MEYINYSYSSVSKTDVQRAKEEHFERLTRTFLTVFFLYSCFSGAIRKWVISTGVINNIILVIQLIFPFGFWILIRKFKLPLNPFLIFYVVLLIILALNPMNLTVFHGMFGIITHLDAWLLVFFFLPNLKSIKLERLVSLFVVIAAVEIVLGFVQYSLPREHFLNKYSTEGIISDVATIGDAVRITGSFSYLGGYSAFLLFLPLLIWTMIRLSYPLYMILSLYAGGLVACFMNGGRAGTYVYLLIGVFIILYQLSTKNLIRFGIVLASFALTFLLTMTVFKGRLQGLSSQVAVAYENFDQRRTTNIETGEENSRLTATVLETIFFRGKYPILGVGLGATYQGATITWGVSKYAADYEGGYEEEPERIIIEGGYVLFFVRLFLLFYFFCKSSIPRLPMLAFMALTSYYIPIVFNTYNAFFWFFGLCLLDRSYRIEKSLSK